MPKALVLGGYGLIGAACRRALGEAGFQTAGMGRSRRAALREDPDGEWHIADLTTVSVAEWRSCLQDVDVVVNAAGALQEGSHDHLDAIHDSMLKRLLKAAPDIRLVQISAAGVSQDANINFFRSKARGDAHVMQHCKDWVILRPTLVLSPEAYGGTALLRAIACLPVKLRMFENTEVQTVHIDDLTDAVVRAARGDIPSGTCADITAPDSHSFPQLLEKLRHWQGGKTPSWHITPPKPLIWIAQSLADGLGYLGWRTPLRSTALKALETGITGDPTAWRAAGGNSCRTLAASLASLPNTRQERLFARVYLALPLVIATLSLFWLLSGLITFYDLPRAMAALSDMNPALSRVLVVGGATADIALGLAILWRRTAIRAAFGMAALATTYLCASLLTAPDLWADPLGPMIKVFPSITLALLVPLLMEDR